MSKKCTFFGKEIMTEEEQIIMKEKLKNLIPKMVYKEFWIAPFSEFCKVAAEAVRETKAIDPHIKLCLMLPPQKSRSEQEALIHKYADDFDLIEFAPDGKSSNAPCYTELFETCDMVIYHMDTDFAQRTLLMSEDDEQTDAEEDDLYDAGIGIFFV